MFNLRTNSHSRFADKLDRFFWFLVYVLPLLSWCILFVNYHGMDVPDILSYVSLISPFPFIQQIFDSIFTSVFGHTFALCSYISYLVGVEIVHCLFDVCVFIPRFAHKLISKGVNFGD